MYHMYNITQRISLRYAARALQEIEPPAFLNGGKPLARLNEQGKGGAGLYVPMEGAKPALPSKKEKGPPPCFVLWQLLGIPLVSFRFVSRNRRQRSDEQDRGFASQNKQAGAGGLSFVSRNET